MNQQQLLLDDAVTQILEANFDVDSKTCILTILKMLDNVIQQPWNAKVKSIRLANPTFDKKVVQKKGLGVFLACGFVQQQLSQEMYLQLPEPTSEIEEQQQLQAIVQARQTLTQVAMHQLQMKDLPRFQPPPTRRDTQNFNVYQGKRFDGQSAAIGTSLGPPPGWKSKTELELQQLQAQEAKLQATFQKTSTTLSRDWMVMTRTTTTSSTTTTTTASDVINAITSNDKKEDAKLLQQLLVKQQQQQQQQLNGGFTTKAMRDLKTYQKKKVYSHAQLQIGFPDGVCVRGNFLPKETIGHVLQALLDDVLLVMDANNNNNTNNTYYPIMELYLTPPRTLLDASKSLESLGLVPAAKIHVSWKKSLVRPNNIGKDVIGWYIRPALWESSSNTTTTTNSSSTEQNKPQALAVKDAYLAEQQQKLHQQQQLQQEANAAAATTNTTSSTLPTKRKKTKAEKEALLLQRMMGGK